MSSEETIITNIEGLNLEDEKKPYLTVIKGSRLGEIFSVHKPETTVGRSPECDLWIEDSTISRQHFLLTLKNEKVIIQDLNSTNGTYLNGSRIYSEQPLRDGDKIQISQSTIFEINYLDESRSLSEQKRYEMGVRDPATNIFNKRYFMDRLKEEFAYAKRKKSPLSLILFDIDYFKILNDSYGHLAGDLVLQNLCNEVNATIRSGDLLARFGGEEFVILMRDSDGTQAYELAERIRRVVENMEVDYQGKIVKITVSCGIATFNDQYADDISFLAAADKFLYRSKKQGRNRVSGPL